MEYLIFDHVYAIFVLLGLFIIYWSKYQTQKKKLVGFVKEIRTHPVKSAKPVQVKSIEVTKIGLKYDR